MPLSQQARFLPPTTGEIADSVATGDFNRDGKVDLVVLSHDPCFALLCAFDAELFVGNGNGTFQKPSGIAEVNAFSGGSFAIADFNGDGNLDVAFESRGRQGGSVTVVPGNRDGTFQTLVNLTVGLSPVSLVAADLNGDKLPDLALADPESMSVSVLLNTFHTNVPTFPLSLIINGSGTGVVSIDAGSTLCTQSCTSNFFAGSQITLAANADAGSNFVNWSGACSGTSACSVTMNAAKSVTATFNSNAAPDF